MKIVFFEVVVEINQMLEKDHAVSKIPVQFKTVIRILGKNTQKLYSVNPYSVNPILGLDCV